ncbi:SNF2 family amino-terminal protein [Ceratobasidium theobromae]|uniref:SNF2 family amino-terminal protein n=1 Tax=Ceratobasidium theobromae TaxID=1582974 RepID=A0A5N5Q8A8_9AGAM|nr:SNF2 family amino-terminal protein [Ceratobasidium theobromae]
MDISMGNWSLWQISWNIKGATATQSHPHPDFPQINDMPAVNNTFTTLVHRYTNGSPPAATNPCVWDSFPFTSPEFREHAGIESLKIGLSKPPVGRARDGLNSAVVEEWPKRAQGAMEFLRRCDRAWFDKKKEMSFEAFQSKVLNVTEGKEDWVWITRHFFGTPAGLRFRLSELMMDLGCSPERAYRRLRDKTIKRIGEEEFRESMVMGRTKYDDVWPDTREAFARAVFGDSCCCDDRRADPEFYPVLRAMTFRIFESGAKKLRLAVGKLETTEKELGETIKAVEEKGGKASIVALRKAIRLTTKVIETHRAIGMSAKQEEDMPWRKKIDQLMQTVGKGRRTASGKIIRTGARTSHIVEDPDLIAAWDEYQAMIWRPAEMDDMPVEDEDDDEDDNPREKVEFSVDAGVAHLGKMTMEDMWRQLGLRDGLLPGRAVDESGNSLRLAWHQWVSILEMVDRSFTATLGQVGRPTLLADEVGFGKTAQVIGYLQVLWHLKTLQDSNVDWPMTKKSSEWPPDKELVFRLGRTSYANTSPPRPPSPENGKHTLPCCWSHGVQPRHCRALRSLGNKRCFMGRARIPDRPSIIICATSLVGQWRHELRRWISPNDCHILVYRGNDTERERFFQQGSDYERAMNSPHPIRTIIIVETPSLIKEGRNVLKAGPFKANETARADPIEFKSIFTDSKRILNTDFLLGVLEEAHDYRNVGPNYCIMLTMLAKCVQRLALTGGRGRVGRVPRPTRPRMVHWATTI